MKKEKLEMKREDWEYLRQYRQAPYQKRYLELQSKKELSEIIEPHN